MRAWILFAVLCILFLTGGCETKSSYVPISEDDRVKTTATFSIGGIRDKSDFLRRHGAPGFVDPVSVMAEKLREKLDAKGAYGDQGEYCIMMDILSYSPGSALIRWLFPGEGATELEVYAIIADRGGNNLATLFVKRSVAVGGGYTAGAWRYVFDDVAEELVEILRFERKRRAVGHARQQARAPETGGTGVSTLLSSRLRAVPSPPP